MTNNSLNDDDDLGADAEKAHREREVFSIFAEYAGLPIVPESVESRLPPEPDIVCRMTNGKIVAFELGELSDQGFRKGHGTMLQSRRLLQRCLVTLPQPERSVFARRFADACIRVHFDPAASLRDREAVLPPLYRWIAEQGPHVGTLEADDLPNAVTHVIQKVLIWRPCPRLWIEPGFGVALSPPDLRILYKKTRARYVTEHPVELLLHFWFPTMAGDKAWLAEHTQQIRDEIDKSIFRRIWIFDVSERTTERAMKLVYPALHSLSSGE